MMDIYYSPCHVNKMRVGAFILLGANGKRWRWHARRRTFDVKRSSFHDLKIVSSHSRSQGSD